MPTARYCLTARHGAPILLRSRKFFDVGNADHVETGGRAVIQASKLELRIMRYELTEQEWSAIGPMLPNKPRGIPRVNDRRVLNGIFRGFTIWCTVARCAAELRPLYYLLQPLRSLASSGRMGPDHER